MRPATRCARDRALAGASRAGPADDEGGTRGTRSAPRRRPRRRRVRAGRRYALVEAYPRHAERWRVVEPVGRLPGRRRPRPTRSTAPRRRVAAARHQRQAVDAWSTPPGWLDQTGRAGRLCPAGSAPDAGGSPSCAAGSPTTSATSRPPGTGTPAGAAADPDPVGGCPGCAAGQPGRAAGRLGRAGREALGRARPGTPATAGLHRPAGAGARPGCCPWQRAGEPDGPAGRTCGRTGGTGRERAAFPMPRRALRLCALAGHPRPRAWTCSPSSAPAGPTRTTTDRDGVRAAGALVCAVAGEAGLGDRRIRRPAYGTGPRPSSTVATLGARPAGRWPPRWPAVDARNGIGHQSGRIAAWLAERPPPAPVPLAAGASRRAGASTRPTDRPTVGRRSRPAEHGAAHRRAGRAGATGTRCDADGTVVGRWGEAVVQFRAARPSAARSGTPGWWRPAGCRPAGSPRRTRSATPGTTTGCCSATRPPRVAAAVPDVATVCPDRGRIAATRLPGTGADRPPSARYRGGSATVPTGVTPSGLRRDPVWSRLVPSGPGSDLDDVRHDHRAAAVGVVDPAADRAPDDLLQLVRVGDAVLRPPGRSASVTQRDHRRRTPPGPRRSPWPTRSARRPPCR